MRQVVAKIKEEQLTCVQKKCDQFTLVAQKPLNPLGGHIYQELREF